MRKFAALGALFCGLSVALGAFGAHALGEILTPRYEKNWNTASNYLMFHGLALIVLSAGAHLFTCQHRGLWSARFFAWGAGIFSGTLYALVLFDQPKFGMITPIGGSLLIIGWVTTLINLASAKPNSDPS